MKVDLVGELEWLASAIGAAQHIAELAEGSPEHAPQFATDIHAVLRLVKHRLELLAEVAPRSRPR